MDLLMFAADAVFSVNPEEDLSIPLTPKKGTRSVFGEITNTVNLSPEKYSNSPLQTLFTAPTLSTPKTKSRILSSTVTTPGSRGIIGRGSNGKSFSYPSPGSEVQTSSGDVVSPHQSTNGGSGKSPLTPMSNLKLLTRIASMEESLTSKKVLFQSQSVKEKDGKNLSNIESLFTSSTTVKNTSSLRRHNSDSVSESRSKIQIGKSASTLCKLPARSDYPRPSSPGNLVIEDVGHLPSLDDTNTNRSEGSRKDKSLGVLSEKFLEYFPMEVSYLETPRRLVIDEVASMLGTERRRVYDIINVLESLNMATRVQKNMYQWMGKLHLEETLGRLKALGHKLNISAQLQALQHLDHDFKIPQRIKTNNDGEKADTRREKSLGVLCQKFLMLLLVSPEPHIISLESAVRMLVGEPGEDSERLRTRGRRLYDIANVLTSLGLVKRVPTAKAFQYIGPEVESVTSEEDTLGVLHRHSLLPSRLGSSGGKENTSFGDHDVTPSNVAPPVQKRGRPRKLSTDFSASALPAAKRSRLQRTRSEDITTSKPTRKFTRHPSLHDICQVAEVEREKLLQKEQQQHSHSSSDPTHGRTFCPSSLQKNLEKPMTNAEGQPVNSIASVSNLLRCRLTSHGKIPVALTFQGCHSQQVHEGQVTAQPKIEERYRTPYVLTTQPNAGQQTSSFSHQNSEGYRASHLEARNELPLQRSFPNSEFNSKSVQPVNQFFCTSSQRFQATPVVMMKSGCTMLTGLQQGSHGASVGPTVSKNTRVIKVITKTGGSSQQESSTVITVLPATQMCSQSSALPKEFVVQASGGFQQVSPGIYTNGHKVTGSNSSRVEEAAFSESRQESHRPYSIYTLSKNVIEQRAFAKVNCPRSPVISCPPKDSRRPVSSDSLPTSQLSLPQVSQTQVLASASGTRVISSSTGFLPNTVTGPRSFIVCNQNSSRQWQPSPDGSSTDSELEEIFGNAFNYTRPKSLVSKNYRESEPPVNKM